MKGRRRVKEGVLSLETIETWMMFVSEGGGSRQIIKEPLNRVALNCGILAMYHKPMRCLIAILNWLPT